MIGSTLVKTLTLLKAELGSSLTIGSADNDRYYQMLETKQEWFASMYDWNQLIDEWEVASILAGSSGRFNDIPTTDRNGFSHSINFDRPVGTFVKFSQQWIEVGYGIGPDEMNVSDSYASETQSQIQKWQVKSGDRTKFEIWPLGDAVQSFLFRGQRKVTTLRTAGVIDSALTLDLDDRLIALSVAVDVLTAKEDPATRAKSEMLTALWQVLRSVESKPNRSFPLGSGVGYGANNVRKVVPITVG